MDAWSSADIEFVGGPSDGRMMTVPTAHMGRPPHTLRLPVEQPLTMRSIDEPDPTQLGLIIAIYESSGVMSDDKHVWLYQYRGLR